MACPADLVSCILYRLSLKTNTRFSVGRTPQPRPPNARTLHAHRARPRPEAQVLEPRVQHVRGKGLWRHHLAPCRAARRRDRAVHEAEWREGRGAAEVVQLFRVSHSASFLRVIEKDRG